jgi:zinc protease
MSSAWTSLPLVTETLANGLRVLLAPNRSVPLAFLSWTSEAGIDADPPGFDGLASLTLSLLREGTARRGGHEITQAVDNLGAELVSSCEWDSASLNLGLLSRDLAPGLDLLIDMACTPSVPVGAVARHQQRRLADLARRRCDPQVLAQDALARALFGTSRYGRPPLGTPDSVARIDALMVSAFHDARYTASSSCLVIAGDVDVPGTVDLLSALDLPVMEGTDDAGPPAPAPIGIGPETRVHRIDVPHAPRTEIRVGHVGVARVSGDAPALELLAAVLGGGPSSRLARRLRQDAGVTYHVRCRHVARRFGGSFVIETSVPPGAAAMTLGTIDREIARLCEARVPGDEIERARRALHGGRLRCFQDLIGTGSGLGPLALYGDPLWQLERWRQAIEAIDADGLRAVACRLLAPERRVAVLAGPVCERSKREEVRCK